MRKTGGLFLAIFSALMVQGCDSNVYKDNKRIAVHNGAATDTEHRNDPALNEYDARFVTEAINSVMLEEELGKLAQQKGSNQEIKAFGALMLEDHTKSDDELRTLALRKNIPVPATLGMDRQKIKDELSTRMGTDFDKAYLDYLIWDHERSIRLLENTGKNIQDPDLKAFVAYALPTIKLHLEHGKAMKGTLKQGR